MLQPPPISTLFPYTTLFRSYSPPVSSAIGSIGVPFAATIERLSMVPEMKPGDAVVRSEEHTSELQSQSNLVCRLLLEKKKKNKSKIITTQILYNRTK